MAEGSALEERALAGWSVREVGRCARKGWFQIRADLNLNGSCRYLYERLSKVPGVTIYGPKPSAKRGRAALAAFNVEGLHATDVSTILDISGVAVRSGHHCTQPLHR